MKAMKAWKGLLVAVLLLCSFLCVASVNTSAVSAAGEHTHPICGKTHTDIGDHTAAKCETVTYTAWDGTFASSGMPDIDYSNNDTAYVYLTRSVEITYELEIPKGKTLYLCLNGYTITKTEMSDTWSAVILSRSGNTHFILCDCKGGGTITHADGVLGRGVRSGNSNGYDKSSFTMYGGTISGNRVGGDTSGDDGAGVFVQSGTFTMYGGKITDNHVEKSLNDGGGVLFRSDDTFIMYGGEISNNYSVDYGGGIIAIGYGSVELRGGTISGNTSDALGGAIWSNKSVTIYEGVNITGNKAVDGGGISTYNTSLTIKGGNITNNTVTTGNGGGVYLNGGTFTISGNVKISGNKKGSSANNVYLPKGETISVIGELTGTTPIGITTKAVPSSSAYVRLAFGRAEYLDPAKFQYENDSNISLVTVGSSSSSSLIACKHNWGTTWQADASGHWHECSLCGGKQAAAEHSGGKATCTESAVCSTCNTPYGEPLGHDFTSDVWQKDETNHWKKCSRCEATDQTAAHTWEDEITLAATCTATGIKTYTCTTCLKTKTETISAKGHNFAKKTGQAATCLDSGWEDYNVCSLCNYVTDYKQIAALGHDFTSSAWQSNADEHWKKCSRCDETTEKTAHVWKDKITAAATCTATGEKTFTCTVCSTTKTETLNALGHELIQHEAKAATCLESGWDAYDTCSRCSYTTFEKIAALGHDKIHHEAQEATCLNIGWNAYDTCTRCSYTTYVEIGKLGHDFTSDVWQKDENEHWKKCSRCDETEQTSEHTWNEEITVAATCTAAGLKTYTCPTCLETKTETISAKGHNITQHEAKAATCTTIGWKAYEDCSDCDYTTYVEIAAYGHDFTTSVWQKDETNHWKKCSRCEATDQTAAHTWNEEITVAATCTAAGLKTYTCIDCRATKTETIAANGHNLTAHEAKAATCTTIGWKAYEDCSDCDYTTYVEIPAYGHDFTTSVWQKDENEHWKKCSRCEATDQTAAHTWNEEITVAATCTATGLKTYTCPACLETKTETISAKGHNITQHDAKDATCTTIGWKAYEDCSDCDYTTYVEIAAYGHDFTTSVWQKDETNHWKKCSRCEATDQTAAHTWNEEITVAATCTAAGLKTYTCIDCRATKTETIAANGHNLTAHEAKAATCTEFGWKVYEDCADCDYTTYVEIAAFGHDFTGSVWQQDENKHWKKCSRCDEIDQAAEHTFGDGEITLEPTCTATGLKTYTCTVCFETKTETIDALGHDEVQHDGKAATCTEFGWKPYVTCNRCEYTTHEKLNALGHDKIHHEAKAATCLEIGYNAYDTCSRCDYTTYVEIAALGHDEIHHDGKAATCTEIGWNAYDTCSRCDYTTYVEIAALGHDEIHHEAKAATCTEIGYNAYDTCSRCDYTTYEEIAALGHDEIHHEAKAATCTEIGYNAYDTCSRCDYTTYVEIAALGHDFTAATWQSNADEHWKNCARCDATAEKASHAGGTATCKDVAVCSTCSATYGELNPDNHAGGTEIRDMVEATAEKVGHTGNSYCKGCNAKIADGKVIPVTVDLSIDQKSDLETAAEAIEKFLSEQNESYTDEQKEELSGSINAIKSALESIARAEDAVSKIEAMPSAADAKPDDKTAIDAFEAAKAAYDALSDDEKRMTGDNSKTTLDAIFKALTAYAVTDGNGSTWAESDNSGLTFTVNGYHEKFAGLVINGETVDKKYYDVKAGSTVITLKAEYLKTLSAGKYTILVQYADGSTDGEDAFTVKENGSVTPPDSASSSSQPSESNSSQATESNKSIVIWIVIPILLIILLIILLLLLKNRKKSEKKK